VVNEISVLNGTGEWMEKSTSYCPLPFLFFLSPLIQYSGIHSKSFFQTEESEEDASDNLDSRKVHMQTLSSLCRIIRAWWMELTHFQSTPEAAKNDQCYSSDATTCETRKAGIFILT